MFSWKSLLDMCLKYRFNITANSIYIIYKSYTSQQIYTITFFPQVFYNHLTQYACIICSTHSCKLEEKNDEIIKKSDSLL